MAFYPITVNTPDDAEPHIYAEDDAAIFQSIFGEDGIFSIGSKLNIEVKTNNLVRVNDGVICVGGHIGRVKYADYIDLTIDNGETGYNRNDLIIGSLSNTGEHTIDTMDLSVIKGTPSEGEAEDPETVSGNLYKGDQLRQVPIARVKLEGLNITGVDMLLDIIPTVKEMDEALAQLNDNFNIEEVQISLNISDFTLNTTWAHKQGKQVIIYPYVTGKPTKGTTIATGFPTPLKQVNIHDAGFGIVTLDKSGRLYISSAGVTTSSYFIMPLSYFTE